jgi:alpha-tubulin suppressor-like RCC1 family protein
MTGAGRGAVAAVFSAVLCACAQTGFLLPQDAGPSAEGAASAITLGDGGSAGDASGADATVADASTPDGSVSDASTGDGSAIGSPEGGSGSDGPSSGTVEAGGADYDAAACGGFCPFDTPVCWDASCVECGPSDKQCVDMGHLGNGVQSCGSGGQWGTSTPCPADAPSCNAGQCSCPAGSSVSNGVCCPAGESVCSGACVDEQTDPANCGGCGTSCIACSSGTCLNPTSIAAGGTNVCGVLSSGAVYCWTVTASTGAQSSPTVVAGLTGATAVSVGSAFMCALAGVSGTVSCWGNNVDGELGNGTSSATGSASPSPVYGLSGVTQISAGMEHACARQSSGSVECWGWDAEGQLGVGTQTGPDSCVGGACSMTPVSPTGLSGVASVTAGEWNTCATLSAGTVQCWGFDEYGGSAQSLTPQPITELSSVLQVSAGQLFACAVMSDHSVECWGNNNSDQLGSASAGNGPVAVPGVTSATAVSAANDGHACALRSDGSVVCWGASGTNGSSTPPKPPLAVSTVSGATQVVTGTGFNCALLGSGQVQCWQQ